MEIDKILTEELKRHSQINSYVTSILEQEEGDAPGDIDIDVTAEEGGDDLEMADVEAPAAAVGIGAFVAFATPPAPAPPPERRPPPPPPPITKILTPGAGTLYAEFTTRLPLLLK